MHSGYVPVHLWDRANQNSQRRHGEWGFFCVSCFDLAPRTPLPPSTASRSAWAVQYRPAAVIRSRFRRPRLRFTELNPRRPGQDLRAAAVEFRLLVHHPRDQEPPQRADTLAHSGCAVMTCQPDELLTRGNRPARKEGMPLADKLTNTCERLSIDAESARAVLGWTRRASR
jgi:hypothetical protein